MRTLLRKLKARARQAVVGLSLLALSAGAFGLPSLEVSTDNTISSGKNFQASDHSGAVLAKLDLTPGGDLLSWLSAESCCAGETAIHYSLVGNDFMHVPASTFHTQPVAAPEPGTFALIVLGIAGFIVLRSRRSSYQALRASQKAETDKASGATPLSSLS